MKSAPSRLRDASLLRGFGSFTALPRTFNSFLAGFFISTLGNALYTFAIPWISYELTRSAVVMGSLFAVGVLPIVLLGPFVGVLVDRFDRRKMMIWSDALRAGLIALIPLFHLLGVLQLWHLYAVSFALAILSMLFDVATVAIIPHIAGDQLTRANSAYQVVRQIGEMLGPVCAGAVIAVIGGYHTLWLDVLSFGGTLIVLIRMKIAFSETHPDAAPLDDIFRSMAEGFHWLRTSKLNLALSLQAMIGNFGYSVAFGILIFYLRTKLGLNAEQIGINMALFGIGGLLGSAAVVPLERRMGRKPLIPLLLIFGTAGFLIALIPHVWLAPGIGFGMVSLCNVAWNVLATSLRQETVPRQLLGRVLSFSRVLTRLAMPVGAMTGGMIANHWDASAVFVVAAAAKGVEVIMARCWIVRHLPERGLSVS